MSIQTRKVVALLRVASKEDTIAAIAVAELDQGNPDWLVNFVGNIVISRAKWQRNHHMLRAQQEAAAKAASETAAAWANPTEARA